MKGEQMLPHLRSSACLRSSTRFGAVLAFALISFPVLADDVKFDSLNVGPAGKGLELQPVTHPDELIKGEIATFRFLVDGKPQGGVAMARFLDGEVRQWKDVATQTGIVLD